MHFIYAYENKINGKIYIGQTTNLIKRDKDHVFGDESMPIDLAINKYGRNNFNLWVISIEDTSDKANQEEIYWISQLRENIGIENVYNIANGGACSPMLGRKHSDESKKKMSESLKGLSSWMKGKHHTEATKMKLSLAKIGKKCAPFTEKHKQNLSIVLTGRIHSEQHCQNISIAKMGKPSAKKNKSKLDVSINLITDMYLVRNMSSSEISKQFNCSPQTIINLLRKHGVTINARNNQGRNEQR